MDIQKVESHAKAMRMAREEGIIGVFGSKEVHLENSVLEELLRKESYRFEVHSRDCVDYPLEVCFIKNGVKYFALYSEEEYKESFGGEANESVATN